MTRIETTAVVGKDRTITVQLPDSVPPGEHAIVVLVDGNGKEPPQPQPSDESANSCLEREGNLLVFTGKLLDDPMDVLRQIREEREQRWFHGPFE